MQYSLYGRVSKKRKDVSKRGGEKGCRLTQGKKNSLPRERKTENIKKRLNNFFEEDIELTLFLSLQNLYAKHGIREYTGNKQL